MSRAAGNGGGAHRARAFLWLLPAALLGCSSADPGSVAAEAADPADILVGSQQTFPPIEYRDAEGQLTGLSVDLLHLISTRLGRRIRFVQADYSALIPGLDAGRFQMASGGISDTEEREAKVDFVNYLMSGASILVRSADVRKYSSLGDFCGRTLATLLGGRVIMKTLEQASADCVNAGRAPLQVSQFPAATDAWFQLYLGRVDGYVGDYPALIAIRARTGDRYDLVGGNYIVTPYVTSWSFPKGSPLTGQVRDAAQRLLTDGSYAKLLEKWGLSGGALPSITVNLPASRRF
ncbi:MAG: ABC transporter substrate-binding protein [Steroidobacteraceae bacterium]